MDSIPNTLGTSSLTFTHLGKEYEVSVTDNGRMWTASVYCKTDDLIGESFGMERYRSSATVEMPMGPTFVVYKPYVRWDMSKGHQVVTDIQVEAHVIQRIV